MDINDIRRENLRRIIGDESQATFARKIEKSPQQVSSMLSGSKSFGSKIAREIESKLGLLSGSLDLVTQEAKPVDAFYDCEEVPREGFVAVPEFRLTFRAGADPVSFEPEWEVVNNSKPVLYREDFFQKRGISPSKCRRAKVWGDSMAPLICEGDTILFEEFADSRFGCMPILDGKIYVISIDGDYRIKYLSKIKDGILITSENPRFKPEEYRQDECNRVRIYGRVYEVNRTL